MPRHGARGHRRHQLLLRCALLAATITAPCHAGEPTRRDFYGDDLPAGAHARLGTRRLRGGARALAFAPDGRTLAAAGSKVRLWSLVDARVTDEIGDYCDTLDFSPDGVLLACGKATHSSDRPSRIVLWDVAARRQVRALECGPLFAFSPDGTTLAAERGAAVHLHRVATGEVLGALPVDGFVASLSFSGDGRTVAIGSSAAEGFQSAGAIHLWDVASHPMVAVNQDVGLDARTRAFSVDVTWAVLSDGSGGRARLWDVAANRERMRFPFSWDDLRQQVSHGAPGDGFMAELRAAISPSGKTLALATHGDLRLYDTGTWQETHRIQAHDSFIVAVRFSRDGRLVACGANDGTLTIWEAEGGKPHLATPGHTQPIRSLEFSRDGKLLVTGSEDRSARLWDVATGRQVLELRRHRAFVTAATVSAETGTIVTGTWNEIHFWDMARGEHRAMVPNAHQGWAEGMPLFPDGRAVATQGRKDGVVHFWDILTAKCTLELETTSRYPGAGVTLSRDGKMLAAVSADFNGADIRFWKDAGAGRCPCRAHRLSRKSLGHFAFAADGRSMALSESDGVSLWDPIERKRISRVRTTPVDEMALSSDGRSLAWVAGPGNVEIYDVQRRGVVATIVNPTDTVTDGLAFSPDDTLLASAHGNGLVFLWDVRALSKTAAAPAP